MKLAPGTKLGSYSIVDSIGVGGMGEVYRAKDTRLPRDAAIKVSSEKFSERFAREAQVIASLNHPNITTLYDVGQDYLVMELVEGPTLAERIRQDPLSLDEAAVIARQIAEALDYAHERGVVHRDLKPANVKIRPDGVVKVLDFGLAKAGVGHPQSDDSPTMSTPRTEAGVIFGTAAYMAPEQAKGKEVDKRADIWAFGCVFYEMLTGAPPHRGDTSQETLASILRDEPDLSKVPAQARRLLKRCLEKDPQKRLRHIGDVMSLLDEPPSGAQTAIDASSTPSVESRSKWLWGAVAIVVLLAAAAIVIWAPWRTQTVAQAVRFEVGETEGMKFFYGGAMSVSPDGKWMVFPAIDKDGIARYWLRSLETVEARALPGTETAYVPAAWSWDNRYVFFSLLNSTKLSKVDIQGGPPQTLAELPGTDLAINGLSSSKDGGIIFGIATAYKPLFRVPAVGGSPVEITALAKDETGHRFPQFLPDGRHFLYLRVSSDPAKRGVYVGSLDAKPEAQDLTRLLASDRQAYYSASPSGGSGYLIFLRETTLLAQAFDPKSLKLSGEAVPIAEGVDSFPAQSYGMFSVSDTGALVYRGGAGSKVALEWFTPDGRPSGPVGDAGAYFNPAVSPDGARIAAALGPAGSRDLFIIDERRTTRLTFDPANDDLPIWSPDNKDIVFASNRAGRQQLYIKPADGSGEERLLTGMTGVPTSWSKDGRFLFFTTSDPKTGNDIWALPDPRGTGDHKPFPVIVTPFNDGQGRISPDGRWIAYTSNEAPPLDVYVRPFSPGGSTSSAAKWIVSKGLSTMPRWRSDGKQLFFASISNFGLMAVDIDTTKGFQAGNARRLFTAPPPLVPTGWSLSPDDKRFLFVSTPDGGRTAPFTVVLNWAAAIAK